MENDVKKINKNTRLFLFVFWKEEKKK